MSDRDRVDTREFRKALGSFTTGVTVVTTCYPRDGEDVGLTVNSFNSVSLEPPMVLWSLDRSAKSLPAFSAASHFAVHILAEDQEQLSTRFACPEDDRFAGLNIVRGPDGIPMLEHCAARFVCRTAFKYEGGDHLIFVGEVVGFDHQELPPLLYHGGQYAQLLKKQVPPTDREHEDLGSEFSQDFLGYLLARCYRQLFAPVKEELVRRGLTVTQYYLINLLGQFDNKTIDQVRDLIGIWDRTLSDGEIGDLADRELVEIREENGRRVAHLTRRGKREFLELASVFKAVEADAERDLDYDQRQNLKLALRQLIETTDRGPPPSWRDE